MDFSQLYKKAFPEVFGNNISKLALLLDLIEPRCGGVLIVGKKGTGKSLLLKCFKKLLRVSQKPFVEIPLGVTEEALLGGIDIEKTVEKGVRIFQEGLLEKGKNNFVLIDDINLFPEEYLGLIFERAENFNVVATLNPDEGFLSSHFLDRFGMCVFTDSLRDLKDKEEFLRFYTDSLSLEELFLKEYEELARQIEIFRTLKKKVKVNEGIWDKISDTCLRELVFTHRAEIFLYYASLAYTLLKGELYLKEEYIDEVAPLVLVHRKREVERKETSSQQKEGENEEKEEEKERGKESHSQKKDERPRDSEKEAPQNNSEDMEGGDFYQEKTLPSLPKENIFEIGEIFKIKRLLFKKDRIIRNLIGRRTKSKTKLKGGRTIRSVQFSKDKDLDLFGTIRAASPFQKLRGRKDKLIIYKEDFRYKEKERKIGHLVVFCVDGSGSIGVQERMKAVKGAIFSLLMDCYQKRDKVCMILFRKNCAEIVLPPTSSVELAYKKLKEIPTGGTTPLADGLLKSYELIKKFHLKHPETRILFVLLTDGKGNISIKKNGDPVEETRRLCEEIKRFPFVNTMVIDCEIKKAYIKFDLAKTLAEWLSARYFVLEELKAESLTNLVQKYLNISD